jgi:mRNA interferase MazF
MAGPTPKRGEVWIVDFGMVAKVRPALVLSMPYGDQDRCIVGVVPHTTSVRGSQYEVAVSVPFLDSSGAFLLQGFATFPPRQFVRRLGALSEEQLQRIEDGMRKWLGL